VRRAKRRQEAAAAIAARARWLRVAAVGLLGAGVIGAVAAAASSCSGWDPRSPFERNAPEVDQAIRDLDAGNLPSAEEALEKYLGTGACTDGGIAVSDAVKKKPNGGFDLGLVLFYMAERYGRRFGDEELGDGGAGEEQQAELRSTEIDCALPLVKAIASDPSVPAELRARAFYLAGNLEFLRRKYEEAVKSYDQALGIVPGLYEEAGGDGIGRDAAWNRAIALRRIQDQKDAGQDGADGSDGDDGSDGADAPDSPDAPDGGDDGGDSGDQPDSGGDGGGGDGGRGDAGADAGGDASPQDQQGQDSGAPESRPPPPQQQQQEAPSPQQDERMLEKFEEAPTYQEQEAKARAGLRRGRAMEDK
jgi:tetratricopeptide (TPR) repeat protein